MKKWTENAAIAALTGDVKVQDKVIVCNGGFKGLTACSAYDYLTNHCRYHGILKAKKESKDRWSITNEAKDLVACKSSID
jgi:hypothetical protein